MSMRYPGGLIATSPVNARYPSGVWTQAQAAPYQAQNVWTRDQFWPYTTLLLQGDGAVNGAQNNTFLDSSSNNFTITRNGNTTQGAFTPYEQDGYWSNFFSSANYLSAASNAAFAPGTGDFTVEAWINHTSAYTTFNYILGVSVTGGLVFYVLGGVLVVRAFGVGDQLTSTYSPPLNQWTHVAAVRSGTTLTIYANGTAVASTTNSYNFVQGSAVVGNDGTNQAPWLGYISNLRFVKGTAVYTSNFTPPAAPLTAITNTSLLTCQSNRFRDNSTNNFTISTSGSPSVQSFQPFPGATTYSGTVLGGSGYFDGSGDWLNLSGGSPTAIGTGSGTVEFWMYATANDGYRRIVTSTNAGFTSGTFVARFNNGNFLVGVNGSEVTVSLPTTNQWYHIAWVGTSGTSQTVYINGVSAGTGGSYNATESINFVGGNYNSNSEFFAGYLAGVRVVKGTAVYTGAFTPPTTPPTAITNTSLLLNFTNAGIFDAAAMNDLETVGNAQVSTSVVKYGTGSMYFDGTDDRLTAPASVNMAFGTGDFTIEGWFYTGTPSSNRGLFQISGTAGGLQADNLNNTAVYCNSSVLGAYYGGTFKAGTTPIAANTWTHFALVRNNSVTRLYVNGVLDSGFGSNSDTQNYTGQNLCVGGYFSTSYLWNGNIDDFRVTKAARYLTSFTPPPARMPGQ